MGTLTDTAYYSRKTINWSILVIIFYIIARIAFSIAVAVYLQIFPPQPPPPNYKFDRLPAVKFPSPIASPSGEMTYRLETIEGYVPHASDSAIVYFMPKNAPALLGISNATTFAKRLNFGESPIQETKSLYRFSDEAAPLRMMRYDIVSKNFYLRYGYERDVSLFAERDIPFAEKAQAEARSFITSYGLKKDDISMTNSIVTPLRLLGDKLVTSPSVSLADAVRVDMFRMPIDGTPVVSPYPDEGPISVIISGNKDPKKRILQVSYTYWAIDTSNFGTYGLKTSNDAWMELQSGKGYVARYPKGGGTQAVIRSVYLAYYDSTLPQTYLQPVFTFEGDDGFLAYVPAILPEWTE